MSDKLSKEVTPDEVVQSAPPGTPPWSLGVGFVFATFLTSAVGLYLAFSPDLKQYQTNKHTEKLASLEVDGKNNERGNALVLELVKTHAVQVTTLSEMVGALEAAKRLTEARVDSLQALVEEVTKRYENCQGELQECKTGKKIIRR